MTPISYTTEVLGVVGGLGPIASAEFLRTIYDLSEGRREQETPFVVLHSDPSYPDRTMALLNGDTQALLDKLTRALECLCSIGATRIVICCITIHGLLPHIPVKLREKVISLVDIILWQAAYSNRKCLLFCSDGTRKLQLFENNRLWSAARGSLILPTDEDQQTIHKLIYDLKRYPITSRHDEQILNLLTKYGADSLAAGCTEIHLVAKRLKGHMSGERVVDCIDPLAIVAIALNNGRLETLAEGITDTGLSNSI